MILDTLKKMQADPEGYHIQKVEDISSYMDGYGWCTMKHEVKNEDSGWSFSSFTKFVKEYFNMKCPHPNWVMTIRFYSNSDRETLQHFFNLFNQFMAERQEEEDIL